MNAPVFSQPFACRTALPPGAPNFAGQKRLRNLLATLGGATMTNSVSIVGPPQSGRSSLLQQLSCPEYLPPALKDALIVQASFRDYRGEPHGAIQYLIRQVALALKERGLPFQAVEAATSMVAAVKQALESIPGRRLVIAIDDFEKVGSDLKKDHQGDLRQAVYHQSRAGYVVASRLPLTKCLQEWGDGLSDFAPILTPMPDLLEPLTLRELQEMVQRALGLPEASPQAESIARFVHQQVGGFGLWAQQALAVLAEAEVLSVPGLELTGNTREAIETKIFQRLRQDWEASYRRLSPSARRVLDQPAEPADENALNELLMAGWAAPESMEEQRLKLAGLLLGRWLPDRRGEQDSSSPPRHEPGEDAYDMLVRVVDQLNTRYQRLTNTRKERIIRIDVFASSRDVPFLRRQVTTEEDFGRFVLSLARLLWDGTGGATGGKKLTLPQSCYQDANCIVRQAMTLRNAWAHLEHPDDKTRDRNLEAETAVYQRYIGTPSPRTPDDFRRLTDALRQETIRFIQELSSVCPFSPELKVENLFKKTSAA
jgi:hypothetical protein